ncbi:MAG: hypothetical protein KIT56_11140 [Gammaproteobacteria bacterium]|nr:hypothetical protein [Gammaproteobacteria bacterium]MCW5584400.1 hypothetical protein [Gammaproteobacteria bacterium]
MNNNDIMIRESVLESSATSTIMCSLKNQVDSIDRKYRKLTFIDRLLIEHLKTKGLNQTQIAGRDKLDLGKKMRIT